MAEKVDYAMMLKELARYCVEYFEEREQTTVSNSTNSEEPKYYPYQFQMSATRWRDDEQVKFIRAVELYGREKPTRISEYVKTKSVRQVISHSQKFFQKLDRVLLDAVTIGFKVKQQYKNEI